MAQRAQVVWAPQPGPQHALITCPVPEVLFGGARGGGKTDGILGKFGIKACKHQSGNMVFFRQEMPAADDLIERAGEIYRPLGAYWQGQKRQFTFDNGARVRFRPLQSIQDAAKYQGQNLSDAAIEEAGQYPDPKPIDMINGALRSSAGLRTQLLLSANPGGAGHTWIKNRYIDPAPSGMEILKRDLPNGKQHRYIYIPSRVENNRRLLENDPDYINRLYLVGSKELVKAWREGDWNIIDGAFFDNWSNDLIIKPFAIPDEWIKFRSFDWGFAKPFSVGWWAVVGDEHKVNGVTLPRGALIRYREWYGASSPNVGLRLTAEQVTQGIKSRESETINYSVADPAIFAEDGGPSLAERMRELYWKPADNKRVGGNGRMGGWDQMRARITDKMLYCFSTCTDSIRTIPVLQHDKRRAEDLDTSAEDHAADEWRYACMSRPWVNEQPKEPEFKDWGVEQAGESWKLN